MILFLWKASLDMFAFKHTGTHSNNPVARPTGLSAHLLVSGIFVQKNNSTLKAAKGVENDLIDSSSRCTQLSSVQVWPFTGRCTAECNDKYTCSR